MIIEVNRDILKVTDEELNDLTVTDYNGSIYYLEGGNGCDRRLTRVELKHLVGLDRVRQIDEVLEMLPHIGEVRYTDDDGLNHISEWEYDNLPDAMKEDFEQIEFKEA